jgi:hypothetical protein
MISFITLGYFTIALGLCSLALTAYYTIKDIKSLYSE